MARRATPRGWEEKRRQVRDPTAQRRALREIIRDPRASNTELGRHVFGGELARSTVKSRAGALRGVLRDRLREELASRTRWSVGDIARLELVEGGPELGGEFAARVHRFHALGRAGEALDPRMPTPASGREIQDAMAEYIRAMRSRKMWGVRRELRDLTTTELTKAPERYLCAFLGINPRSRKLTSRQRLVLSLATKDPEKALDMAGIRGIQRRTILRGLEMVRRIPERVNLIMKLEGLKDTRYGYRRACGVLIGQISPRSGGVLRKHREDWGDRDTRLQAARAALEEAEGDPMKVSSRHIPHPLHYWYVRNRGTRTWSESIAAWLDEAGLVKDGEQRQGILRRGDPSILQRRLLQRAHPNWSRASHQGTIGVCRKTASRHLGLARDRLEAEFERVSAGERSLSEVARELDIGARGVRRLHEQHSRGEMRLWREESPFREGTPPLNREMLTTGDLLGELLGYDRLLKGARGRTVNPPRGARVTMSSQLAEVRDGVDRLMSHGGDEQWLTTDEVGEVIGHLDVVDVERGQNRVTIFPRTRRPRAGKRTASVDLGGLRALLVELRDEVRAHQE